MSANQFDAALDAVAAIAAAERDDPRIDPRCRSFVLHHGAPTGRAVILFHGFTNCPRQFTALADLIFARGYNVYVPRLPRHGLRDKLTTELAGLTVEELTACANGAFVVGQQLGRRVDVLGLSVGATLAAWLAQTQPLGSAIVVSPFFSVVHVPALLEPVLAQTLAHAPDIEVWWDPRVKERALPVHGYPRFPTHALAQCLQLGERVRAAARAAPPAADTPMLVLNAKDPAIDNPAAAEIATLWRARGARVVEYIFENLDARHDIIEPTTYPAAATLVYPVLLELLESK